MVDSPSWAPSDPLGDALHLLRMRGTFYCRNELREPWALEVPAFADTLSFHVLTAGSAVLQVPGEEDISLRPGDLAVVPHARGHTIASSPGVGPAGRVDLLPQRYLSEHYSVLTYGGDGSSSLLLCGIVGFDEPAARELLRHLPAVLHIQAGIDPQAAPVHEIVRMMATELADLRPGGEAVTTRLADIVVVQAIRTWLARDPAAHRGWLSALQDEHLGRALVAIHRDPGRAWTLAALAREARMSRSVFSAEFTERVGEPPMGYLTRWRMNLAHARLREGAASVSQVATESGYGSAAAFTRAFTRRTGQTPGAVRRGRGAPVRAGSG
ncbi:AraC family transcriptional regulator [Pseudactinotalea sp. Z1748]|uniref:AraC family transcriptional regulator n=1 Tax=Pseudactinotalea sp. Z1748 TaxID=3413027 RepID=UPI003C7C7587